MVHQPDDLPERRLSPQIDHAIQIRVIMSTLTDLHKQDPPAEEIDHFLVAAEMPPLNGVIVFPARNDDPKRKKSPHQLVHQRSHGAFPT